MPQATGTPGRGAQLGAPAGARVGAGDRAGDGARFAGRLCAVTGAGSGIGAAVAARLAAEGAEVPVTDRSLAAAEAVAARIGASALRLDVTEEADWDALLAAAPVLDLLVNNAGVTGFESGPVPHDPEHASLADWRAVHRVNLDGVFLGCRAAVRAMRPRGGAIVNVASVSGRSGQAMAAAYGSSKAAVLEHTRSVALWCAAQNLAIRCNAVLPGAVLTPLWDPVLGDGDSRDAALAEAVADVPLRRFAAPEEVAALILWLASDEAAYVTGAEFAVDGGLLAGR